MQRVLHTMALSSLMDFHIAFMPYIWSILIDLALFLPFYVHSKYSVVIHALLTSFAVVFTVLTSSKSWTHGIPPPTDKMHFHKLFGVIIFGAVLLQIILGVVSKLSKSSNTMKPQQVYYLRKIHTYLGYTIALMAKFQVLKILKSTHFAYWFNLFWNIASISLFIYRKITQQRLSGHPSLILRGQENIHNSQKDNESTLAYGNYLYSRQKIEDIHPAGRQLINSLKGASIDRYLYGMMPAQNFPQFPSHSHSTQALKILGPPVGRIEIKEPYINFDKQQAAVSYYSSEIVSQEAKLYLVLVELQTQTPLKFGGYSHISQLGRYYSITNQGITRLYSVVNFLAYSNVLFLKNVLGNIELKERILVETSLGQHRLAEELNQEDSPNKENLIPLLIKYYPNGRFTPNLLRKRANSGLKLSTSKGRGLELDEVSGTIVLVGGGTGINPYCDLIDLLFKDHLMGSNTDYLQGVLANNPILRSRPFDKLKFILLFSVNYLSEIHPFTLRQLTILAEAGRINLKIRIKEGSDLPLPIAKVQQSFEHILHQSIRSNQHFDRIYICGTQKMNSSISKCLQDLSFKNYIIL